MSLRPRVLAAAATVAALLATGQPAQASPTPAPTDQAAGSAQASGFTAVATFDDYVNGSIRDQGPWHVDTTGSTDGAYATDDAPDVFAGKAMVNQLSGFDQPTLYRGNAYADLGAATIPADGGGTVFFEALTTDLPHTRLHLGLGEQPPAALSPAPGDRLDLDGFGPEVVLGPAGLVARDGGHDEVLRGEGFAVADDVRLRVWLVIDNASDTYTVQAAAGDGAPVPLRAAEGSSTFAFRSPGDAALTTFWHLNDPDSVPTADSYLDSLMVDPTGADLADPTAAFTTRETFDDLRRGAVDGQSGWSASGDVAVATDPTDPGNQALQVGAGSPRASHALPADPGTVFFRMRRIAEVNTFAGLTDVDRPAGFGDFRAQTGSGGGEVQQTRDGGSFATTGTWPTTTWQCVWLVPDRAAGTYAVWSRGGPHRLLTRLSGPGGQQDFALRSTPAGALDRFLAVAGKSRGAMWIDDVASSRTVGALRAPDGATCQPGPSSADDPVADPAPAQAQSPRLRLSLTERAQLPRAQSDSPARRINTVVPVPGSDRLAVPALEGPLYLLDGSVTRTYLDLPDYFPRFVDGTQKGTSGLGTGFGYVAFAPDFADSGLFYTVHTEAGPDLPPASLDQPDDTLVQGVLTEWDATDPGAPTFAGTHREVMRLGFSRFTHGIQEIAFDPLADADDPDSDYGLLYVGTGDGDETPEFSSRPGSLAAPQGKVLRIDPTRQADGAAYGVPKSNPFVGKAGALGEVYALGLRNPHRFSWDPDTGKMLLGNIGEKKVDSVYEVEAGDDFGWNRREGRYRFDHDDPAQVYPLPDPDYSGVTYPVLQIGRDAGNAVVGGYVYRGSDPALAALRGHYVFGDIVDGRVREVAADRLRRGVTTDPTFYDTALVVGDRATTLSDLALDETGRRRVDLRLGQDAEGGLYVLSKALGRVWAVTGARTVSGSTPTPTPTPTPSPTPAPPTTTAPAPSCNPGRTVYRPKGASAWAPLSKGRWRFTTREARQIRPGKPTTSGPRRPREYAVLRGHRAASFDLQAQVRIDRPVSLVGRDVVLVFDYVSARSFSYVHLSNDTGSYAHNGIFTVNGSDRRRVDDQWNGTRSAPAAITDSAYHDVRLRYCAGTHRVGVYVDGHRKPLMTARSNAFGRGRVGFGSFDDKGAIRGVKLTYTPS